jgi:hypothetical protein
MRSRAIILAVAALLLAAALPAGCGQAGEEQTTAVQAPAPSGSGESTPTTQAPASTTTQAPAVNTTPSSAASTASTAVIGTAPVPTSTPAAVPSTHTTSTPTPPQTCPPSTTTSTEPQADSGIKGLVTIGPISPVEHQAEPNLRPYSATIMIQRANGTAAATVSSGQDGRFSVALPPGDYVVVPQNGSPLPRAESQQVTVDPHQFTEVEIQYDSGIR